jgi:thiol-disulfide isomerase/thioredoxin
MRKILFSLLFFSFSVFALSQTTLPAIFLNSTDGSEMKVSDLKDAEKPIVISFWATYCAPCLEEFEAVTDLYNDWRKEVDFMFVAINIDDARSTGKVKSLVAGKDWPFIVLLDYNQEVKRAMNVTDIPFCMVFDRKGKMLYKHTGYVPGNEAIIFDELKKASGGKK